MDLIKTLQSAINYIEDNLLEHINYEDVAQHLYISSYHFHRIFSLVTGMTVAEYIRNRRLSLASQELLFSDIKIIDIALKYCYESPESFTKAFTRFHGITPNMAKKLGNELKLFSRLQIKIIIEGGMSMDYRIEKIKPFKLITKVKEFSNEIINDSNNKEIPCFWEQCKQDGTFSLLEKISNDSAVYGVCSPISNESKYFKYGIGKEFLGENICDELVVWDIKHELWAVFKCIGTSGNSIGDTWNKIFTEFLPNSEYVMIDDIDFEYYSDNLDKNCFCEIWIPIAKK